MLEACSDAAVGPDVHTLQPGDLAHGPDPPCRERDLPAVTGERAEFTGGRWVRSRHREVARYNFSLQVYRQGGVSGVLGVKGKKFLTWAAILFVLFFVINQPAASAGMVKNALGGLGDAATKLAEFVKSLT